MQQTTTTLPKLKTPPGPKKNPLLGNMKEFKADLLLFLTRLEEEYPKIAKFHIFHIPLYHISEPEYIKHVLQTNNKNYHKSSQYNELKLLLGEGLVNSEGDFWRKQRRLAQPAFHREKIIALSQTMMDCTMEMVREWEQKKVRNEEVNMLDEMMGLTLHIAGKTLLSTDVKNGAREVGEALSFLLKEINTRAVQGINLPLWVPVKNNRRFIKERAYLDNMIYKLISDRRKSGAHENDLLSMFMNAYDEETGETMNDKQLRDEVMTIILAGHETTAIVLAWAWYLLSQHPEVEKKFHQELDEVLEGRTPTAQDVPKLKYTLQIIEEVMRLYPPIYLFARQAQEDDQLGEYLIPKGGDVHISPFVIHRMPEYWPDPLTFDPDRFLPENSKNRNKFTYLPFGGGPRICIGNNFALMEMQLIMATIGQMFKLSLRENHEVKIDLSFSLRPNEIPMKLS